MISKEEIQHIAQLARIRVNENDLEKLQQDLSEILEYFNVLKEANVSGIEPMTLVSLREIPRMGKNVSREDVARPGSPALLQKLVTMFSAVREGFLRVKAIFSR